MAALQIERPHLLGHEHFNGETGNWLADDVGFAIVEFGRGLGEWVGVREASHR